MDLKSLIIFTALRHELRRLGVDINDLIEPELKQQIQQYASSLSEEYEQIIKDTMIDILKENMQRVLESFREIEEQK